MSQQGLERTRMSNKYPSRRMTSVKGALEKYGNQSRDYFYTNILPHLESYMDGRIRRIVIESIDADIARRLAEAKDAPKRTWNLRRAEATP
jgi:hypothetical protein